MEPKEALGAASKDENLQADNASLQADNFGRHVGSGSKAATSMQGAEANALKPAMPTSKISSAAVKPSTRGNGTALAIVILAVLAVAGVIVSILGWVTVAKRNDEINVLKADVEQREQIIENLKRENAAEE